MITILYSLKQAEHALSSNTDTPSLDAELLLAHVLNYTRTQLHTWPEREISKEAYEAFKKLCEQRLAGIPIAYIIGHKSFWKFDLAVTPDVLIPRPETELLVEVALSLFSENKIISVVDLGTGSGAIALALAYERPNWKIYGVDDSEAALTVAKNNAAMLELSQIVWKKSHWFNELSNEKFNLIVSNPPYIEPNDPHLIDLQHEPKTALIAEENGLKDLKEIISKAPNYLIEDGYLAVEHGYNQADKIQELMKIAGFIEVKNITDLNNNPRVTIGHISPPRERSFA